MIATTYIILGLLTVAACGTWWLRWMFSPPQPVKYDQRPVIHGTVVLKRKEIDR